MYIKLIKSKNYPNVYKIHDLLYDSYHNFVGYTMDYYSKDDLNILMDSNFLIKVIKVIKNVIDNFTNDSIYVQDLSKGNIIYNKNDIVLIDCDLFKIMDSPNTVYINNYLQFKSLIINIIKKEFINRYGLEYLNKYSQIVDKPLVFLLEVFFNKL